MGNRIPMFWGNVAFSSSKSHEDLSKNFRGLIIHCQYVMYQKTGIISYTTVKPSKHTFKELCSSTWPTPKFLTDGLLNSQTDKVFNSCSPAWAGPKMFSNIIQDSSFQNWCQHCPLSSSSCCLSVLENGIHWTGTMFLYRGHAAVTLPLPPPNIIHITGNSTYVLVNNI